MQPDDETEVETDDEEAEAVEEATPDIVGADGAKVEPVGAGGRILVWECSVGDFTSRSGAAAVNRHIADVHGKAKGTRKR